MLPGQVIAAQMLGAASHAHSTTTTYTTVTASAVAACTPSTSTSTSTFTSISTSVSSTSSSIPTPSNSSSPSTSPDRSCAARTISSRLFADLGLPAAQDIVYAHRRSGAASDAAMRTCCGGGGGGGGNPVGFVPEYCVLWCAVPPLLARQMRTADGQFITAPFESCLEHAFIALGRNGTGGQGEGAEEGDEASAAFGPIAVHKGEAVVSSGARTGRMVRGAGILGVLLLWLFVLG